MTQWIWAVTMPLMGAVLLQGCGNSTTPQADAPAIDTATSEAETNGETGTLQVRANGEDFVREGFVTKDGWDVEFDHVYVTLDEISAFQTNPPFNAEQDPEPQVEEQVTVSNVQTIDLAEGGADADTILIAEVDAPAGQYNALSWKMSSAGTGEVSGYPIVMIGRASKDGQTVEFNLRLAQELEFVCGEFVGDERKGILQAGDTAGIEATFHFDHLFGDGEAAPDDSINTGALGFDPLAAIAQDGQLDADSTLLQEQLSEEDYATLEGILPSLGHVGEGHCAEQMLS